jgi:aryl-alcohol dehydrogenase-like predicted oxidoreductase
MDNLQLNSTEHKARLGLGTAQFGLNYGVTNGKGQVGLNDVREIIAGAALYDVMTIDTAAAYGNSEEILGMTLPISQSWEIVTKTQPRKTAQGELLSLSEVRARFIRSLELIRRDSVDALLVHHAADLMADDSDELYSTLCMLKATGRVKKIGVSVYSAAEIDAILSKYPIDIIQLPFNALDQRLAQSGHLAGLKAAGIEVHVRSTFLQGILLVEPSLLPVHLKELTTPLTSLQEKWREQGMNPLAGALSEVLFRPEIDRVIVGVTSPGEWLAIIRAYAQAKTLAGEQTSTLITNEQLIDPSQWGTLLTAVHGG